MFFFLPYNFFVPIQYCLCYLLEFIEPKKNPENLSKSRKMYEICFNNCETSPFPNISATLVFGFVEGSHSIIPANSLRKKKQGKNFFVKLVY